MYLIQYNLLVGSGQHYAPSAPAAVRLIGEIAAGGGMLTSIVRTRDGTRLTKAELEQLAVRETIRLESDTGRTGKS